MYDGLQQNFDNNSTAQRVQIFLTGRNLLDLDFFSKSDPYIKVYFSSSPNSKLNFIGRTQTVDNSLNPNFNKSFVLDYIFEARQEIKFQVYDEDDPKNPSGDDFIGEVVTTLGALTGAKNQTSLLQLKGKNPQIKSGKLIVRVQPCVESNQFIIMKWRAKKLMNTDSWFDFWDKSDPYLKFLKIRSDNTFIQAGRTEVIMDNLEPNWKQIEIPLSKLINKNNQNGKFKVQCWDWQEAGQSKHQFIGQCFLELQNLKNNPTFPLQLYLKNPKTAKPGKIILQSIKFINKPSFVDYLRGGLQLNLNVFIDFTGSNGVPTAPSSLHYFSNNKPNQYQAAIEAVSRILLNYDSDKRIPAFGFGAKPKFPNLYMNNTSHCFPLSGDPNSVQAFGVEHLMELYNIARSNVQLSGPTYFKPLLLQAFRLAQINAKENSNTYQIVLILTDGQIHDMDETVNLIVERCKLPLSIIIVGIGHADFHNMVRLDGDNGLYDSKGRRAPRDIVQFVPFRQVNYNNDLLAKQLLAELPGQVTQYMSFIGKPPGKPMEMNIESLFPFDTQQQDILKQQLAQQLKLGPFKQNFSA